MISKKRPEKELPNYQIIKQIGKGCFGKSFPTNISNS